MKAFPMWFHPLDALHRNVVIPAQAALGWSDEARRNIMTWYYKHNAKYGGPPKREAA